MEGSECDEVSLVSPGDTMRYSPCSPYELGRRYWHWWHWWRWWRSSGADEVRGSGKLRAHHRGSLRSPWRFPTLVLTSRRGRRWQRCVSAFAGCCLRLCCSPSRVLRQWTTGSPSTPFHIAWLLLPILPSLPALPPCPPSPGPQLARAPLHPLSRGWDDSAH